MSKRSIFISSDFVDYYDCLSDRNSKVQLNRYMKDNNLSLKRLQNAGISTVKTGPVSSMESDLVLVRDGSGIIVPRKEATTMYPNLLMSEYSSKDKRVYRVLQAGFRVFSAVLKIEGNTLDDFSVLSVSEIDPCYNMRLRLPLYSIDYVDNGSGFVAIRLNVADSLSRCNIDKIADKGAIVESIYSAIETYNKGGI